MRVALSVSLLLSLASFSAAVQTCVNTNGIVGECISTSSCSGQGGSSDPANLCPGDDSIQCCTWSGSSCNGQCMPYLGCSGTSDPANLCPGGDEVQCCEGGHGALSGYNALQSAHAYQIGAAVKDAGLNRQACLAAITTGITEANLLNYANSDVDASYNYLYDAVSSDYDSVGVFQQRVTYYPDLDADMDPKQAAAAFLKKMVNVDGWETMDVGELCQTVQGSAYPTRYSDNVSSARDICSAIGF
ncbi:hypothetical protein OC846_005384 [Tilletia horrida]|uniref:Uncharacterized protein n=1 Tax=Tilletia horrida TaxID=155126 RepID=A0AAN6GN21_9BASI|nr:hypothetical protein OC846_005384 [Tilletia horrida]KAK0548672.1 hypothetical protein OC845_003461 [Tilletia horrida]KAK0565594.1 hypothetical protein OC861_003688 [Tilletia horrida]